MNRNINQFLILTSGRSGSNTLRNYLNTIDGVRCHGEVFIRNHYYDHDGFRHYCRNTKKLKRYYHYFLVPRITRYTFSSIFSYPLVDSFLTNLFNNPEFPLPWSKSEERKKYIENNEFSTEKLVGFKVAYGSYNGWSGLRRWIIKNPDCKIVHLVRNNHLKKLVSWEVAKQYHIYHREGEKGSQAKVYLNLSDILNQLEKTAAEISHFREHLDKLENDVIECSYETLLLEKRICEQKRLSKFLNLETDILFNRDIHFNKVNSNRIDRIVINFPELENLLRGTKFEHFIYE